MRLFFLAGPSLLALALFTPGGPATAQGAAKTDDLMRRKLVAAQKALEAITLNEPDRVVKYAEDLVDISHKAEWRVLKTPTYDAYSTEFRDAARSMARNAGKKNLDAAALDYVNLTLTCVKCHKHVREKRMAAK